MEPTLTMRSDTSEQKRQNWRMIREGFRWFFLVFLGGHPKMKSCYFLTPHPLFTLRFILLSPLKQYPWPPFFGLQITTLIILLYFKTHCCLYLGGFKWSWKPDFPFGGHPEEPRRWSEPIAIGSQWQGIGNKGKQRLLLFFGDVANRSNNQTNLLRSFYKSLYFL